MDGHRHHDGTAMGAPAPGGMRVDSGMQDPSAVPIPLCPWDKDLCMQSPWGVLMPALMG